MGLRVTLKSDGLLFLILSLLFEIPSDYLASCSVPSIST